MSDLRLRLPDYLHEQARIVAQQQNISVNQLITLALAEKIAVLTSEGYLESRAARGVAEKYHRALGKSPQVEPYPEDRKDES